MYFKTIIYLLATLIIISGCTKDTEKPTGTAANAAIENLFITFGVALEKFDYSLYRLVYSDSSSRDDFKSKYADYYLKNIMILETKFRGEEIIASQACFVHDVTFAAEKYDRKTDARLGTIRANAVVFTPKEGVLRWKILHMITIHND
ncbi:MAG: hypothetical protein PF637_11895 [Spirochaetes bacterium]|jgi:hypothetical protein|nr:hypothetical protein [Spirochaetota bacterium]